MGHVIKGGAIMRVVRFKLGLVENMAFYDRVIRALVGLAMNVPIIIYLADLPRSPVSPFDPNGPQFYVSVDSIYFLLTALLGWDPFYSLFKVKSCGGSGRKRCGSFQYQTAAAMGQNPQSDKIYEIRALMPGEEVGKDQYYKKEGIVFCGPRHLS